MALSKEAARRRRLARTRFLIRRQACVRLCVYRSNLHIYAQVISVSGGEVIAVASTLDPVVKGLLNGATGVQAATIVGQEVARRALSCGITKVAFDRSGYKYHGCIQALANAARECGLQF